MGKIDTESKRYVNDPKIFADIFNYYLFDGEQVIKPEELKKEDTTEIAVPYGNNARLPVQKYRDSFKVWGVMTDGKNTYVLLGSEIQNKVHYAMPVKDMLYDSLDYASQVDAASKSYRKSGNEAEIVIDDDTVKIKLTPEEFLSGFRKADKLTPVITVVIYFGSDEWDGPLSIHEMLDCDDKRILKAIPDYKINLIAPANIPDSDFDDKFVTGLGLVLNALKYNAKGNVFDLLVNTRRKIVDRQSAEFLKDVLDLPLEYKETAADKEGDVNVSDATNTYLQNKEILGAIKILKADGTPENIIIEKIMKAFDVSKQDVITLLHSAA